MTLSSGSNIHDERVLFSVMCVWHACRLPTKRWFTVPVKRTWLASFMSTSQRRWLSQMTRLVSDFSGAVKKCRTSPLFSASKLRYLIPMHALYMWYLSLVHSVISLISSVVSLDLRCSVNHHLPEWAMKVLLHNQELWQKFSEHQNEMMITNSGRYAVCSYVLYVILMRYGFPPLCSWHSYRSSSHF